MSKRFWQMAACCLVSAAVTAVGIFMLGTWLFHRVTGDAPTAMRLMYAVSLLKRDFNGELTNKQLWDGAIKGAVDAAGDPYTVYLNEKDYQRMHEMSDGSFGGIGIVFGKRGDDYVVISALADNPGAKAGIKSGDIIMAVDGTPTEKLHMDQVASKIRGKKGTKVELELKTKDGSLRKVTVVRADIKNQSVGGTMLEGTKVGYIRIAVFNDDTAPDFKKEYEKLEQQGMEALVLDLRANPGGLLTDCVEVAGMLVPKGPIVSVEYRNGERRVENSALEKVKYPLAVLVDHGSASAAEIVAGAVKDTKAGKLFGVKTFGKGSVQSVYPLDGDTAVKITVAKYYTPAGICIDKIGIEPDVVVELPEHATVDTQLEAAKQYLLGELNK